MSEQTGIEQQVFTEAPCQTFTQLYGVKDGQVVQINLTVRGITPEETLDKMVKGIEYAGTLNFKMTRPDAVQAPTTGTGPAPETTTVDPKPIATDTPTSPSVPAAAGQTNVIHAVNMKVSSFPKDPNKVDIEWFAFGHHTHDIHTVRTSEKALALLQSTGEKWTMAHLQSGKEYPVRHRIVWQNGAKIQGYSGYYKDIVSITRE